MATERSERVRGLDVARGIAMLLVCVAHFFDMYALQGIPPDTWYLPIVSLICRVATPTFVLVSGIVLGYQVTVRGALTAGLRAHLLDRALFIATVGHALIALAYTPQWGYALAFGVGYVTDTIAFCVIGGLFIVPATSAFTRLGIGSALLVGSLIGWQFWTPVEPILLLVKSVLLGPVGGYDASYFFPLLPWLGWYLVGSVIGGLLGKRMVFQEARLAARLMTVGVGMIVTALITKWGVSHYLVSMGQLWSPWTSLFQKYPPGPMYLLLMGGTAILLVSGIILGAKARWMEAVERIMEPVGRNSLPVFIAQFFLYFSGMYFVFTQGLSISSTEAGGLLLGSLVALWVLASWCERYGISRMVTTGINRLAVGRMTRPLANTDSEKIEWIVSRSDISWSGCAHAAPLAPRRSFSCASPQSGRRRDWRRGMRR